MMGSNQVGDLFANSGKGAKARNGMCFGYAFAVTLDPIAAANGRAKGTFGWAGRASAVSDGSRKRVGWRAHAATATRHGGIRKNYPRGYYRLGMCLDTKKQLGQHHPTHL